CFALEVTSAGGIAVRPSSAVPPAAIGFCSVRPVLGVPVSALVDGAASESGPGGENESLIAPIVALTAPWLGSFRYITCQITPVAKSEIAIGMNTTVLNATDQRMRSVSTAKMSPIAVTSAGTSATQIMLLRIDQ